MVEIFQTVGIDYRHGPEKGVGFQCFSELLSAYEATMVKDVQCTPHSLGYFHKKRAVMMVGYR